MKNILIILSVAAVISFVYGCHSSTSTGSQHIDVSQIYQTYVIDIDLDEDIATCEAIFTITDRGGNKVILNEPASITANGKPMRVVDEWGKTYKRDDTPVPSSYTFLFTDKDGNTYENSINILTPELPQFPEVLRTTEKLSMETWKDFGQFNSLTMLVKDQFDETTSLSMLDYVGLNEMSLAGLDKLSAGPITILVIYEGAAPLKETTAVGGNNMVYTATGIIEGVTLEKAL